MVCVPIFKPTGDIFAIAQFINRKGEATFTTKDEEQFRLFAEPLGVILENCMEVQRQFFSHTAKADG
jgi:adenylate cyclase